MSARPAAESSRITSRISASVVVMAAMINDLLDFTGTGPVDLTVSAEGPNVHLAVRNEGSPIPHDAVGTIFDPLVRGTSPELQKQRRPAASGWACTSPARSQRRTAAGSA